MKTNIKTLSACAVALLALASCSDNTWNRDYLDGFEGHQDLQQVSTVDYTLTAADYARIADNRFNKALAAEQGVSDALKAVKTQNCLNADIPADLYIPNLLKDSLFSYCGLSDGSAIQLTYREIGELPEVIRGINGASEYTLGEDDYQIAYGGDDYMLAFSPSHPASVGVPKALAGAYDDAENGQYVMVSYAVSSVDPAVPGAPANINTVPVEKVYEAYTYSNGKWSVVPDVKCVNPAEYTEMGLKYGNFSGTQAAEFIPTLLTRTYPYAAAETEKYVAYKYYASGTTTWACDLYEFDGTKWEDSIASNGLQTVTSQFVRRDGKWRLDPSIEFTLPAGKNQPLSTAFYQACVDWVRDNVDDGAAYITSYGNNDYYTGASAYQGNIDLRAASAKLQYSGYDSMTDEEVVALMKQRFETEVCPAVLSQFYPDMAPMGDFEPTVTIHFYIYNGSATLPETIVYKTVAKGKFEFVSCTWND